MSYSSKKKILICGDSFSADWSLDYPKCQGWPNLLTTDYKVTNLSQAGCSEYRIYKQIKSGNLDNFDLIIVSHTSPYRIYVEDHPGQSRDKIHTNCDFLFADVEQLAKNNKDYQSVLLYFKKFFSVEYADFSYNLIIKEICDVVGSRPVLHLVHNSSIKQQSWINFLNIFKKYPGLINHYSTQGNLQVFKSLQERIEKIC